MKKTKKKNNQRESRDASLERKAANHRGLFPGPEIYSHSLVRRITQLCYTPETDLILYVNYN